MSGRDYELRVPTLRREPTVRSEDLSGELQGNTEESRPADPTDDAEARNDSWSIQGDFIHRHHNEPRVQLYVPKDETFPIHLKYIDVTRSTHTDLDVLQEKKIDGYWNIDSTKLLSDSTRGFTKFTLLKEKPPNGFTWSGRRLTKSQITTRPDQVWPEVWTKIGKAQNREEQDWAREKPKVDNARKLRGIYYIDPDDRDVSDILKNARRKLERPMAPVMPCKRMDKQHPSITQAVQSNDIDKELKTMYGCIVESHESAKQRAESQQSKFHDDRTAGKGFTSMTHYNLVHKFIPIPQAMKIPDAKAAVDKEWKKLENRSSQIAGRPRYSKINHRQSPP